MQNLTYGRKKPEAGDDSSGLSGWMKAIEDNIGLDDAHSHNGTDSPKLDSKSVNAFTTTTGTGWGASIGNGMYEMTLSMPTGLDFDKYAIVCKTALGQQVHLNVIKVDSSSFKIQTNDNTQNYTVLLLS